MLLPASDSSISDLYAASAIWYAQALALVVVVAEVTRVLWAWELGVVVVFMTSVRGGLAFRMARQARGHIKD